MPSLFWTGKLTFPMRLMVNTNNLLALAVGNATNTGAMKSRVKQGYEASFSDHVERYDELGLDLQDRSAEIQLQDLPLADQSVLDIGCGTKPRANIHVGTRDGTGVLQNGMDKMATRSRLIIEMKPIGLVSRTSQGENEKDRSLVAKIVFREELTPGLDGIEEWSHIYVIFWLDNVVHAAEPELHHQSSGVGVLATRSPIHPNPIGLTLVELVKREANVLWVRGLDAHDGTPVLDIKPYPDWEQGQFMAVTDFKVPGWLKQLMQQHE